MLRTFVDGRHPSFFLLSFALSHPGTRPSILRLVSHSPGLMSGRWISSSLQRIYHLNDDTYLVRMLVQYTWQQASSPLRCLWSALINFDRSRVTPLPRQWWCSILYVPSWPWVSTADALLCLEGSLIVISYSHRCFACAMPFESNYLKILVPAL